ncbi:hypothetical protein IMSHALPRED_004412 [Imshaugia aleurites]|uniref:Uncharacterized protein n=1 Tax=Imshaugia aleurites TaxID=172621 RepID=A0A8H3F844_9LECA|nr:hypothetical protein IMSHALPRED_004412 [Imshaugia aleurites]
MTQVTKFIGRERVVQQQLMEPDRQSYKADTRKPETQEFFEALLWSNASSQDSTARQVEQSCNTSYDPWDKIDSFKDRLDD